MEYPLILKIESIVEQIEFGSEYKGSMKVNGKEFRYTATLEDKSSEPNVQKFKIKVNLFNKLWQKLELQERIGNMLKTRISQDVTELYSKLAEFGINDDGLLGGILPKKVGSKRGELIESRIFRMEEYGLGLNPDASIRPKEIRKFLRNYKQ